MGLDTNKILDSDVELFIELGNSFKKRYLEIYSTISEGFNKNTTYKSVKELLRSFTVTNLDKEIEICSRVFLKNHEKKEMNEKIKTFLKEEESILFARSFAELSEQFGVVYQKSELEKIKVIKDLIDTLEKDQDENNQDLMVSRRLYTLLKLDNETNKRSWSEKAEYLIILHKAKGLFEFLNEKKYNDIKFLIEEFDEVDENYFLITKLENILRLYEKLWNLLKKEGMDIRRYSDSLREFLSERANYEVVKDIEIGIEKIELIKDLFEEATNNQEANNIKVKKIMNEFQLSLEFKEFQINPVSCKFKVGKNTIDFQDIRENRDKLQLASKEIKSKYNKFIEMIDNLEAFVNNVHDLYSAGSPKPLKIEYQVKNMDYAIWNAREIAEEKRVWKEIIESEYEKNFMSTLFWGRQLCLLSKMFENQSYDATALNLLEFIFGGNMAAAIPRLDEYLSIVDSELPIFEKMKSLSDQILEETEGETGGHSELMRNLILPKFKELKGDIKLIISSPLDVENRLLSLYNELTQSLPSPQSVLFCNKWTKKEQIFAFLYRCFTCSYDGVVFTIINYENLLPAVRNHFEDSLLNLFSKYERTTASLLVIFTCVRESQFNTKIASLERISMINLSQLALNQHRTPIKLHNEVHLVTSEFSGLGKSFFIKKTAQRGGMNYFYFPISGDISVDLIVRRFINLKIDPDEDNLLHIDIEEVTQESVAVLNELMFKILILRGLFYLEEIFYLPENVRIYIELGMQVLRKFRLNLNIPIINLLEREPKFPLEIQENSAYNPSLSEDIKLVANFLYHTQQNTLDSTTINIENLRDFPAETTRALLENCFDQNVKTYYQKLAFISSLADQLRKFSMNFCFSYEYLTEIAHHRDQIRQTIFNNILKNTSFFVKLHYQNLIEKQKKNLDSFNLEQYDDEALRQLPDINKEIISFAEMGENFILTIFDKSGSSIYPIQSNKDLIPRNLINIYIVQERNGVNEGNLRNRFDYSKFSSKQLVDELSSIFCLGSKRVNIENYVFTPDNFLKMNLIYLKTCSRVPVIMCGETGCGKTSLLKIMVKELLGEKLHTINFHSGVTQAILVERLQNIFKEYQSFRGDHINDSKKKIWIFLDEINTCDCLGLVSELMVKRTLLGVPVQDDFIFVAACNPFRLKSKKDLQFGLRSKQDHGALRLAYIVKPLPINLMNFVFDFGALKENDEVHYIDCMLKEINLSERHGKSCLRCLIQSQKFIREKEESSSVSLRDINRFTRVYAWFIKINRILKELKVYDRYGEDDSDFKSLILSLFVCYYFKLKQREDRERYLEELAKCFENKRVDKDDLKKIYNKEVEFYLKSMEIPEGIAKNESLKENVFIMLVSVCNRIPVIVSGKPGCSKTLSVTLIQNNMNGRNSVNEFFKRLPRIYFKTYQGSLTSTSEEIEKVFESAYKKNKEVISRKEEEDVRIVVFFDELGLAEISRNNPLKVLHGLLEPDINDKEKQVGFIGISNWRLDASKINRVIYLAKPDPEESDLKKTAREIALSYGEEMKTFVPKFEDVAKKYHDFKAKMIKNKIDFEEFFGTRDFYSCIKLICYRLKKEHHSDVEKIIGNSIYRNFGGISDSIANFMQKDYNSYDNEREPVLELIKQNLKDDTARYLMMITKHKGGLEILSVFLSHDIQDPKILVGSSFEDDLKDEEYAFKILSEIIDCTEKGKMVVLLNLNVIYPTLYDLFNQNFKEINKEKRCRIALGIFFNLSIFFLRSVINGIKLNYFKYYTNFKVFNSGAQGYLMFDSSEFKDFFLVFSGNPVKIRQYISKAIVGLRVEYLLKSEIL